MEFIKRLLAENLGGPFHLLASKDQSFSLNEVPDLRGKVGLVTGGTEGVGFACSYTLLSRNISKLFILSVSKEKAEHALSMIEEKLGPKLAKRSSGSNVTYPTGSRQSTSPKRFQRRRTDST